MKKPWYVAALAVAAFAVVPTAAAAQHPWSGLSAERQIQLAVQASPEKLRDGATVQGWTNGKFGIIRKGTDELICMAPDPASEHFEVSCHYAGLEAFFARGRELTAQGIKGNERVQARWKEYDEGKLAIPMGSVNYILTGSGFDAASGEIQDPYLRWTIYTPGATTESTGLSTEPSPGGPWLMFGGTAGAHIMITPPKAGGEG